MARTDLAGRAEATVFPSDADYARLRALPLSARTDDDLWRWHAYLWGWRVACGMAPESDRRYPLDPAGEWWSPLLSAKALGYWRRKLGQREPERFPPASGPEAVRTCVERIPWRQMTPAEQAVMRPKFVAAAAAARRAIAAAGYRWARALGGDAGKAGAKAAQAVPEMGGRAVARDDLGTWR